MGDQSQGGQSQGGQSQGADQQQGYGQQQSYGGPAAPVMAAPVAAPLVAAAAGDGWDVVVLVSFGVVIAVGLIAANLLHWRADACEPAYCCLHNYNPVSHGRGCDSHNREGSGVEAGSRQPHAGLDAFQIKTYGYGLCTAPNSGISVVGFGGGGSSML